jgi:hypothetical protein
MPPAARENFLKKVLSGLSQKLLAGFASMDANLDTKEGRKRAKPLPAYFNLLTYRRLRRWRSAGISAALGAFSAAHTCRVVPAHEIREAY